MKRFVLIVSMTALIACSRPYCFVQMSDPQIGFLDTSANFCRTDSLMKLAVGEANALQPVAVFMTGDMVNQPWDGRQDSIYRARKAEIQAPVWEVPGNHDVLSDTLAGFSTLLGAYISERGYARFSFRERGDAFIGIDSNCIKEGDAEAEHEQLQWLRKQLEEAAGRSGDAGISRARYIFVFLHCPIIRESIDEPEDYFNFPPEKRREYISLFESAGVTAVFAGHTHKSCFCSYDGIDFYTAGPVGIPLGGGVSGFNVVRVSRSGIAVEFKTICAAH